MKIYCGIDQGKLKSDLCLLDEQGKILTRAKVDNSLQEILRILTPFGQNMKIVFESSATWYWLADGLQDHGYHDITMAHASKIAMITKARVKTDRRDAQTLAELLRVGFIPPAYIYPKDKRWLRDLARTRMDLVSMRAQEFTRLRMMAVRYGKDDLKRGSIAQFNAENIEHLLDEKYLAIMAPDALERMTLLSSQIADLEKTLSNELNDNPMLIALKKIPGVGQTLSLTLFLESGDLQRFPSAKEFCSYCRVAPGMAQSGNKSAQCRNPRQGSSFLKYAFMQAAVAAVRCYPNIKKYYDIHLARRAARGGKMLCYNIIAHKLALAAWLVLHGKILDMTMLFDAEKLDSKKSA